MPFPAIIPPPSAALQYTNAIVPSGTIATTGNFAGFTVVDKFLVGAITATGNRCRVRVREWTASSGTISAMYIGQVATSGNAYNFDGGQVQVTWNGGASDIALNSGTGTATYDSDDITFTIDDTKAILIAMNILIGGTQTFFQQSALGSNFIRYHLAAVQQASSTLKSAGYGVASGVTFAVSLVQVATA